MNDRQKDALKQAVVVRLGQIGRYLMDDRMDPKSHEALRMQRDDLVAVAEELSL